MTSEDSNNQPSVQATAPSVGGILGHKAAAAPPPPPPPPAAPATPTHPQTSPVSIVTSPAPPTTLLNPDAPSFNAPAFVPRTKSAPLTDQSPSKNFTPYHMNAVTPMKPQHPVFIPPVNPSTMFFLPQGTVLPTFVPQVIPNPPVAAATPTKRERKPLVIVDPNSNKPVAPPVVPATPSTPPPPPPPPPPASPPPSQTRQAIPPATSPTGFSLSAAAFIPKTLPTSPPPKSAAVAAKTEPTTTATTTVVAPPSQSPALPPPISQPMPIKPAAPVHSQVSTNAPAPEKAEKQQQPQQQKPSTKATETTQQHHKQKQAAEKPAHVQTPPPPPPAAAPVAEPEKPVAPAAATATAAEPNDGFIEVKAKGKKGKAAKAPKTVAVPLETEKPATKSKSPAPAQQETAAAPTTKEQKKAGKAPKVVEAPLAAAPVAVAQQPKPVVEKEQPKETAPVIAASPVPEKPVVPVAAAVSPVESPKPMIVSPQPVVAVAQVPLLAQPQPATPTTTTVLTPPPPPPQSPPMTTAATSDQHSLRPEAGSMSSTEYQPSQWSPWNLEGQRVYDKNFLLKFKPHVEPDQTIIERLQSVTALSRYGLLTGAAAMPDQQQAQGGMQSQGGRRMGMQERRGRPMGNRRGAPKSATPNLPVLTNIKPLEVSDNGWKRPVVSDADSKVIFKFNDILNKLVAANMEELFKELLTAGINSEKLLKALIDAIFERALKQPKWAALYALLCRKTSDHLVIPGLPTETNFRRLLLNKCQEEFETNKWKANKKISREGLSAEAIMELEAHADKDRTAFMGNILFIGELFKQNMLHARIIHGCIQRLLADAENPSIEDMEAVCKLLTVVGKTIDIEAAATYVDAYMSRVREIIYSGKLPSRIKFLLQGLLDLRATRWTPRDPLKGASVPASTPARGASNVTAARPPATPIKTPPPAPSTSPSLGRTLAIRRPGAPGSSSPATPTPIRPTPGGIIHSALEGAISPPPQSSSTTPPPVPLPVSPAPRAIMDEPATPEELATAKKKLSTTLEEFINSKDAGEALACLNEIKSSARKMIVPATLEFALMGCDNPLGAAEAIATWYHEAQMEESLRPSQWTAGFSDFMTDLPDIIPDCTPKIVEVLGLILGKSLAEAVIPLKTLLEVLIPVAQAGVLAPRTKMLLSSAILAEALATVVKERERAGKEHSEALTRLRGMLRDCPTDIRSLLPTTDDVDGQLIQFLGERKLVDLFPALTSDTLSEAAKKVSTATPAELDEWIRSQPAEVLADPDLSIAVTSGIMRRVFANIPELSHAIRKEWLPVLNTVLAGKGASIRAKVGAICVMQKLWVEVANKAAGVLAKAMDAFKIESLLSDEDISLWKRDKSTDCPDKQAAIPELCPEDAPDTR